MATIERRGSRYRARWRDPDGRQRNRSFGTEREAKNWLIRVGHDMLSGGYVDPSAGAESFREVAERWRKLKRHEIGTQEQVESYFRNHVYELIGDRRLSSFRPSDVQEMVNDLEQRLSPRTVSVVYGYVSNVFKFAVRDRLISASPCVEIELTFGSGSTAVEELLTTDQVASLAAEMPTHLRALVAFDASTGLRPGEMMGLTVDRIDFDKGLVVVDRQMFTPTTGSPFLKPPKTDASTRVVPVPQFALDAITWHLANFPAVDAEVLTMATRRGKVAPAPAQLVFRSRTHGPLRRNTFVGTFSRAAARAGLPSWATPHDLRHYYASTLIHRGLDPKVVSKRLGHKSVTFTIDVYGHLWPDHEDRTREAVAAELGGRFLELAP